MQVLKKPHIQKILHLDIKFSFRDIFGPTGRLIEIMSSEDQASVVEVS